MTGDGESGGSVGSTLTQREGVAVVSLSGELDLSNAGTLRKLLEEQVSAQVTPLVVDLTPVSFMDSTALGVLVRIRKLAIGAGRAYSVVCPPGPVLRLLNITGLADVFGVHDTLEAAVASVNDA